MEPSKRAALTGIRYGLGEDRKFQRGLFALKI